MSSVSEAIIVAIITGGLSLLGVIWTSRKSNAEMFAKLDKQSEINDQKLDAKLSQFQAVTDTKLEELTREVRKHNEFATRVPVLEEKVSRLEKDIGKSA